MADSRELIQVALRDLVVRAQASLDESQYSLGYLQGVAEALSTFVELSAGTGEVLTDDPETLRDATEEFRRAYVLRALERCQGNRTRAAKVLGVDVRTVFRYLEDPAADEP